MQFDVGDGFFFSFIIKTTNNNKKCPTAKWLKIWISRSLQLLYVCVRTHTLWNNGNKRKRDVVCGGRRRRRRTLLLLLLQHRQKWFLAVQHRFCWDIEPNVGRSKHVHSTQVYARILTRPTEVWLRLRLIRVCVKMHIKWNKISCHCVYCFFSILREWEPLSINLLTLNVVHLFQSIQRNSVIFWLACSKFPNYFICLFSVRNDLGWWFTDPFYLLAIKCARFSSMVNKSMFPLILEHKANSDTFTFTFTLIENGIEYSIKTKHT